MALSLRLSALAQLILPDQVCADVGTDHGQLAVALVLDKRVPRVIATDVGEAPLAGARALVARQWRSRRRVELRLGDGLAPLRPGEASTIVVAGMGGLRILRILDEGAAVVAQSARLVLQPNTDVTAVREWVAARGHLLEDERLVHDQGRWYPTLAIAPRGDQPTPAWTKWDLAWGPVLRARRDPSLRPFLGEELPRVAMALARARAGGASVHVLESLARRLSAIEAELARLAMAPGGLQGRGQPPTR